MTTKDRNRLRRLEIEIVDLKTTLDLVRAAITGSEISQ